MVGFANGTGVVALSVESTDKFRLLDESLYRKEGLILSKLDHPNIIRLIEVVETANIFVLVLEMLHVDALTFLNTAGTRSEKQAGSASQTLTHFKFQT